MTEEGPCNYNLYAREHRLQSQVGDKRSQYRR